MHRTAFQTPILEQLFAGLGWLMLKLSGWRVTGELPPGVHQAVIIGAPHTSNWDFPLAMAALFTARWRFYWVGKHSLFQGLAGPFMRFLGGIALDRSRAKNTVQAYAELFQQHPTLKIMLAPEGTRSAAPWRTGFYHIALQAGVPIVLGFVDRRHKTIGLGPCIQPSGDLAADLALIRAFYQDKEGLIAGNFRLPSQL